MDKYGNAILQVVKVGTGSLPDNRYMITISSAVKDVPPSRIDSLRILSTDYKGNYDLSWLATGDDGIIGSATSYILKYSDKPILTETDFNNAAVYKQNWVPVQSGYLEKRKVLINKDVYFAIRAIDDEGNRSDISNNVHLVPKSYVKRVYPNPYHPKSDSFVKVEFVPALTDEVNFSVYTVDGNMVYNDTKAGNIGEQLDFYWDGKFEERTVASGVYYFVITLQNKSLRGKFALIK